MSSSCKHACNVGEYWPWEAKQTQLARGDVIPFYGFKRLGQLMVDEPWPSPDDQQGYLQILDEAMLRKIMPWRGTEPRQVLLSLQSGFSSQGRGPGRGCK
eukprot:TRINITY_DN4756_c0_g1_i2.p1 TRINITY_DN4756_c0_g1~~TRINITY_DN4756_c0_g1_i2.p1  ORF type:complete len:100 (-),score=15.50 TRINITY_DN4756_c0_g1_i2:58-357(-)